MPSPNVLILRAPGSNCDQETQYAFEKAGARAERLHILQLREQPDILKKYQILVIPGGFTYGDDVAAGKILASQITHFLKNELRSFRDAEKLVLGVCNGFQVLLKSGLIIQSDEDGPCATLTNNNSGRFESRWVHLQANPGNCPFLKGIHRLFVPVAHGEGKFVTREPWILHGMENSKQIVLRYVTADGEPAKDFPENPNGSMGNVAGACDPSGRVLGLMPHPERHILPTQNPHWTRNGLSEEGDGFAIFKNAVKYFQ